MREAIFYVFIFYLTTNFCNCDDKPFPDLKKLMENGFVSEIEITNRPQDETISVTEYFYGGKNQTRIDILRKGKKEIIYFYPNQDQIAIIKDDSCTVQKLGQSEYLLNYNFTNWIYSPKDSKDVYFGPSSLLRNAAETPPIYTETKTIRGITCHEFSHQYPENEDIDAYYYFTLENWITPANITGTMVPVRIQLTGKGKVMEDTPEGMFVQTIDYVFFRTSINKISLLEPSTGYGCKGLLNQGPDIPPITSRFDVVGEFYAETANPSTSDFIVTTFRSWYDYNNKLSRLDVNTKDDRGISTVFDFNTGLMYRTTDGRNCKAEPIRDYYFETFKNGLAGIMKDPKTVLQLDGTFYYLGKTYVRGIRCDIWESIREDVNFRDKKYNKIVYTYYFTSHLWEIEVEGTKEEQIPVRVEMNLYDKAVGKPKVKMAYNLFGFNKSPQRIFTPFSISGCAGVPSERKFFSVSYSESIDDVKLAEKNAPMVKTQLQGKIASSAKISPLRLPFIQVDYEPGVINVIGLILERVPALTQFKKPEIEDKPNKGEKEIKEAKTDEDCAHVCVGTDGCTAFHLCGTRCFISTADFVGEDWGEELNIASCSMYIRIEQGTTNQDVSLKEALDNIEKAVKDKSLVIVLVKVEGENTDEIILKPDEFLGDISPFSVGDHDKDMFEKVISAKSFKNPEDSQIMVDAGIVISSSDCYRKCRDEKNMFCSSFTFCGNNNKCILSPLYISLANTKEYTSELEDNTKCNIYTISYLEMFEQYEGQVSLIAGRKEIQNVETDSKCAKNCREEQSFTCRGFEYCNSQKVCQLHEKHVLDMKSDMTKSGRACNHYALKFSADYVESGRLALQDPNGKILSNLNFEECARSCSEKSEFKCVSFDFCSADDISERSCRLNTQSLDTPGVKFETFTNCKHYTKKSEVDEWANLRQAPNDNSKGYTSGQLTALIFGMIFFGLIVGIAVFLGYSYFRNRSSQDGISVKFMKQENA